MRAFLDTSALVKRCVDEPGSETLALIVTEVDEVAVSAVCRPECVSAFRRLVREARIDAAGHVELKGLVLADLGTRP